MSRVRHIPIRTCMGCGATAPQPEMLRIVRDPHGHLCPDVERRASGRGGYLHRQPECWAHFARRKGSLRSLRAAFDRPARAALVAQLRPEAGE